MTIESLVPYIIPLALGGAALYVALSLARGLVTAASAVVVGLVLLSVIRGALVVTPQSDVRWEAAPPEVARWRPYVERAAAKCGVPAAMVAATLWRESGGDSTVPGAAGEIGLMQIMPYESRPLARIRSDPAYNIEWGACYLAQFYKNGNAFEAFARYNKPATGNYDYARKVYALYKKLRYFPPMQSYRLTQRFGNPVTYQPTGYHTGIDIAGPKGSILYAVDDGVVEHVGDVGCKAPGSCYGNYAIKIRIADNAYLLYGHGSRAFVKVGQRVKRGQPIGVQGDEGYSSGDHLHLELVVNGKYVDPMNVVP